MRAITAYTELALTSNSSYNAEHSWPYRSATETWQMSRSKTTRNPILRCD